MFAIQTKKRGRVTSPSSVKPMNRLKRRKKLPKVTTKQGFIEPFLSKPPSPSSSPRASQPQACCNLPASLPPSPSELFDLLAHCLPSGTAEKCDSAPLLGPHRTLSTCGVPAEAEKAFVSDSVSLADLECMHKQPDELCFVAAQTLAALLAKFAHQEQCLTALQSEISKLVKHLQPLISASDYNREVALRAAAATSQPGGLTAASAVEDLCTAISPPLAPPAVQLVWTPSDIVLSFPRADGHHWSNKTRIRASLSQLLKLEVHPNSLQKNFYLPSWGPFKRLYIAFQTPSLVKSLLASRAQLRRFDIEAQRVFRRSGIERLCHKEAASTMLPLANPAFKGDPTNLCAKTTAAGATEAPCPTELPSILDLAAEGVATDVSTTAYRDTLLADVALHLPYPDAGTVQLPLLVSGTSTETSPARVSPELSVSPASAPPEDAKVSTLPAAESSSLDGPEF